MAGWGAPLLLVGPPGSGRSALLFRAARAAPPGRVLFLAPRPLHRLPHPAPDAVLLQRIQFLYPASLGELLQLLASLHEVWPGRPSLMVLDSLEEYLAGCPGPHLAAQLAALLLDTAHHFSQQCGGEPGGCQLIVSVRFLGEGGDGAEQLSVVRRYFPAQCWLRLETPESRGSDGQGGTRLVRACLSQPGTQDQEWRLTFEPQEEMKFSPLPRDRDSATGSHGSPATDAAGMVPDSLFWTSGGP
ncbi:ATPase SWSAP1 [Sphaerodactylus townsendi]|nr:ATPase SWSAP1 [Sphaerodactylus townsendi]